MIESGFLTEGYFDNFNFDAEDLKEEGGDSGGKERVVRVQAYKSDQRKKEAMEARSIYM